MGDANNHMASSKAVAVLVLTFVAFSAVDASDIDTVVPETTLTADSSHLTHLHPLALVATNAIQTELANLKKSAPGDASVAAIEAMVQTMNQALADPQSSHTCK